MKMLFDIGNTRIKAATSSGPNTLASLPSCSNQDPDFPRDWQTKQTPTGVYVASVAAEHVCRRIDTWAKSNWDIGVERVVVQPDVGGMRTAYNNPEQLGVDRWLAALAAYHLAAERGACVIDAGTALTVDVVDRDGLHRGGLIAPGFNLMIESLTQRTEHLQLENISVPDIFALDTESAISLGCADYVAGMVDRVAMRLKTLNFDIDAWFITGGQAELVTRLCDKPMTFVPDLVLQGIEIATEGKS